MGKTSQLGDVAAPEPEPEPEPKPSAGKDAEVTGTFTVGNAHGLHARPAARLVEAVAGLGATVTLRNLTTGAGPVPGDSMMWVSTLGAEHGHEVRVDASGPGAAEALAQLQALAAAGFGDEG
ncbi:HPr family phosphocarrier protein [Nocardioides mangrovicus]|uniref:HPr family phosphocarrier protein n=1 Tax=Nocardioides mangrovicus TaxID=2478913 RepID=UPI002FCD54C6